MAANKYIALLTSGAQQEIQAKDTSAGAADAGKIVALNASGVLDSTLFPAGIGQASQTFTASEALSAGAIVNIFTSGARNANATDGSKPAIGFVNASVDPQKNVLPPPSWDLRRSFGRAPPPASAFFAGASFRTYIAGATPGESDRH